MSSRRKGGQLDKGKNIIRNSSTDVDDLNQAVQDMNMDSGHDGSRKRFSKRKKNRAANGASSKHSGSQIHKPNPQRTCNVQPLRPPNNVSVANQMGRRYYVLPPLPGARANMAVLQRYEVEDHNDSYESDDELNYDEYDSDENPISHEVRKKNRWFADFFETLDSLTVDQINEPTRQWHCPACQDGPGAIDWYCSILALVAHAKTKGSKRVKIHRDLAEILEEDLRRKGATVNQAGKSYGQWKGLNEVVKDKQIVWPPMVIIMNTRLGQDENEKWVGMGNPELLDYFGSYEAVKARHSYGPKGHMGMSVLIFESSAVGYTEAERLSRHFENEGTDRVAWDRNPGLFYPGGKRKLYGYMATKGDIDIFNKHSKGKSKLRFEMVSYQEKVVDQLKQMNEENQQLHWYKDRVVTHQMHAKALEESIDLVSAKLRKKEIEDRIKKERTQQHCEELEEALDSQEQFFKDQLKLMKEARNAKESRFDNLQEEDCMRVEVCYSAVDPQREEKLEEIKEFEEEKEKLKSMYMKKKIELEKWFDTELTRLMDKYTRMN
ncbi:hypothetical protein M8C21_000726 [Ambrosia artemisiifolia]|uniref:Protein SUPPRESSOR OF GENE SILENCING 3-like protein n=1 Tax=Ambrosia artemisiifolia TaxID=4212 RepID=A0AAD5CZE9_AMBAR|nr:hypothetical protein M8C21_000726 [Ambrosia artemisiifolia]